MYVAHTLQLQSCPVSTQFENSYLCYMKLNREVKSIITFKKLRKELPRMGHTLSTVSTACGICNIQHGGAPSKFVHAVTVFTYIR
jgi:hypothetical protein